MKYENSKNRFSELSLSSKTFLLNLFSCLINSFVINDVCKNLENVNVKVKTNTKRLFVLYIEKNWKTDLLGIMNEKNFNFHEITRFQAFYGQRRYEKLFLFFPFLKK